MKAWHLLLTAFVGIAAFGGGYYLYTTQPWNPAPPPTPAKYPGPEIAPGLPEATTVTKHATSAPETPSSSPTGAILQQGSVASPIVGDNLMLGIDINSKLGEYLLGYTGMTLYTFSKDNIGTSTCYYACAELWPPYIVSPNDHYNLQYGVDQSKVSFITRADGSLQLTYGGRPLYFYSGDVVEREFNGQGFHGSWYVVKP